MSRFVCVNKKCRNFGKEDEFLTNSYKMIDGKLVSENAMCPCCGDIRKEICDGENIPLSEKNISIGEYSSMSKEQKTAVLKKRSHDHFERKIKGKKRAMIESAISDFNNK